MTETTNKHSSTGIVEDLLTNIMHLCAIEYHLNILIRKYEDENKFIYNMEATEFQSTSDLEEIENNQEKLMGLVMLLNEVTANRRKAMLKLKESAQDGGNPDLWCLVKHVLTASVTAFEVFQNNVLDRELEEIWLNQSRVANQVIAGFLGYEVTPCSACLSDQMRGE